MNYEPAKKNIMAQEEFPLNDPPEFHMVKGHIGLLMENGSLLLKVIMEMFVKLI